MDKIIKDLLAQGISPEDLLKGFAQQVTEIQSEMEKEKEKDNLLEKVREDLAMALTSYVCALGIIEKEPEKLLPLMREAIYEVESDFKQVKGTMPFILKELML